MLLIKFDFISFVQKLSGLASGNLRYFYRNRDGSKRNWIVIYNTLGLEIDLQYHDVDTFELELGINSFALLELRSLLVPADWIDRDFDSESAALAATKGIRKVATICNGRRMVFELHCRRFPVVPPMPVMKFESGTFVDPVIQTVTRWKFLPTQSSSTTTVASEDLNRVRGGRR